MCASQSSHHLEGSAPTTSLARGPVLSCLRDSYKDINLVTVTLISDSHLQSGLRNQGKRSDKHFSEPQGRNSLNATGLHGMCVARFLGARVSPAQNTEVAMTQLTSWSHPASTLLQSPLLKVPRLQASPLLSLGQL